MTQVTAQDTVAYFTPEGVLCGLVILALGGVVVWLVTHFSDPWR